MCRGRDLNPPQACLAIFQSRALCSKVDPSCCQLKADVDAGPHLLSSGPSANARRWIPPGCILPGLNGPAWILWEDGVEELVEALAAHPGRKDERSVHPFQPLTRTPGWVRHPLGVVDDTGDTDERRIEWTVLTVHELVTLSRPRRPRYARPRP